MGFYDEMQAVAAGLLAEFKQGVVMLMQMTPGTPDPATPWIPGEPTETTYELDATVSAAYVNNASATYEDGSLILASDLIVTCAVPPVAPQMGDRLAIDGRSYSIKQVNALPAAGTPAAYKIFVRA